MNPNELHPNKELQNICFIKNVIKGKNVIIGDYTYYNCSGDPTNFEKENITYHYEELGDKLIIGKFCSLGENIKFIMNAANHNMKGITSYPFTAILRDQEGVNMKHLSELPVKGDTIVGNDVWIGENVTILPGIHIGDGAIIGANSVVSKNVPAYTIAAGNPVREIRKRYTEEEIQTLEKIAWWNWPIEKILKNLDVLLNGKVEDLIHISRE